MFGVPSAPTRCDAGRREVAVVSQLMKVLKGLALSNERARLSERRRQAKQARPGRPDAARLRPVLAAAATVAVGTALLLGAVAIVAIKLGFWAFV
jgi:hypothetical protein